MATNNKTVIFVYNADSGLFNTVTDIAHKIFSPSTYSCQLCQLTHSYFSVREQWQQFLSELDYHMEFLHKDEFQEKYNRRDIVLPVILIKNNEKPEILMDKKQIDACDDLDQLMSSIKQRLQNL